MGEIEDGGTASEVEIVTKNYSLVDKLLVVNGTGSMRSVYQPRTLPGQVLGRMQESRGKICWDY